MDMNGYVKLKLLKPRQVRNLGKVSVFVHPGQGDVGQRLMSGHFSLFSVAVWDSANDLSLVVYQREEIHPQQLR